MSRHPFLPAARARWLAAAMIATVAAQGVVQAVPAVAQDQDAPAAAPADPAAPEKPTQAPPAESKKKRHVVKKPVEAPKKPAEAAKKPPEAPATAAPPAASATADGKSDPIIQQLAKAGVKTCLSTVADLGKKTLPGVSGYARAANWQSRAPDERVASVILGQSYPEGAPLPHAFAMLFGAPAGKTKCDGYSVQVIPTKDKCSAVETKISVRGKKIGDLSGVPFLNDVNGAQVLLLPSAGDGCVLVGIRIDYAD